MSDHNKQESLANKLAALDVEREERVVPQSPDMYKVLLLNDDFTPVQLVVDILMKCFGLTEEVAGNRMFQAHSEGQATVFSGTLDQAETRVLQATLRVNGVFPLLFQIVPI